MIPAEPAGSSRTFELGLPVVFGRSSRTFELGYPSFSAFVASWPLQLHARFVAIDELDAGVLQYDGDRGSHRVSDIGLRALHGWNREAGTTTNEHDAGSAQLSWAGHYIQTLPPSDDRKGWRVRGQASPFLVQERLKLKPNRKWDPLRPVAFAAIPLLSKKRSSRRRAER